MNIIFMGTPKFGKIVLDKILECNIGVMSVITQPDKPSGRGQKTTYSQVKELALNSGITVYQPEKIDDKFCEVISSMKPDLIITAAYGKILPQKFINLPKYGVVNVHASLLPKYRGASPIYSAIIEGEKVTGITLMKTDIGMDTGDIIEKKELVIYDDDTTDTLSDKLALLGGEMVVEFIIKLKNDESIILTQQEHDNATKCRQIKKEDSILDFNKDAETIHNIIRAGNPWPQAQCELDGDKYKIIKSLVVNNNLNIDLSRYDNGDVIVKDNKSGLLVKCGNNTILSILTIKPESSKELDIKDFLNGKGRSVKTWKFC